MFAEHDELEDIVDALKSDIAPWCEAKTTIQFIYRDSETDEAPRSPRRDVELGVELSVKNNSKLKDPLNALYKIAQKHQCEFVVGQIDDGEYADVCYFGYEEGRPDYFEIGNYLGL